MTTATDALNMATPNLQASPPGQLAKARGRRLRVAEQLILIPLEARPLRLLALAIVLGATASLALAILHPALADWLASRAMDRAALECAVAWHPGHPELHPRLARAYANEAETTRQVEHHLATALRQRPTSSAAWLQLALWVERQGDLRHARLALDAALGLNPHDVNLRWEAASLTPRAAAIWRWNHPFCLSRQACNRQASFQLVGEWVMHGSLPQKSPGLSV